MESSTDIEVSLRTLVQYNSLPLGDDARRGNLVCVCVCVWLDEEVDIGIGSRGLTYTFSPAFVGIAIRSELHPLSVSLGGRTSCMH